jgi:ABC-type lipopolysaccharide export system ATPase subunit
MTSQKSYCNTIVRDNVTVTLTIINKNNNYNNNLINNILNKYKINNIKNKVNVTVTLSCVLLLHYLISP